MKPKNKDGSDIIEEDEEDPDQIEDEQAENGKSGDKNATKKKKQINIGYGFIEFER